MKSSNEIETIHIQAEMKKMKTWPYVVIGKIFLFIYVAARQNVWTIFIRTIHFQYENLANLGIDNGKFTILI